MENPKELENSNTAFLKQTAIPEEIISYSPEACNCHA